MITTNQEIITYFYRTWCCLPHQCLRRTCSQPSPALFSSTRCCCPYIESLNASYTLKLPGGDCVLDPRGREVLERPLWSVEGCQDLGRQEKGVGEWRKNPSLFHLPFIFFVQVLFLKEFCQFSQTLQPQSRESFYKTLSNLGVLPGEPIILLTSMTVGTDNVEYLCSTFHGRSRDHTAVASEGNEGSICRHSPLHRRLLSLVGEALFAPPFPLWRL